MRFSINSFSFSTRSLLRNRGGQWADMGGFGFKVVTQFKPQSQKIRLNLPIK
jgi:hypothetical protein